MPITITEQLGISGLTNAQGCLEKVFPDPRARPSLRWFKGLQAAGKIPFRKIGRKVWFDPEEVRRALDKQFRVQAK
jgi:hypothetical protein